MPTVKNVARGIVIWLTLGAVARADGIDSTSWRSSGSWYFFFRGNSSRIDSSLPNTTLFNNSTTTQPVPAAAPPVATPAVYVAPSTPAFAPIQASAPVFQPVVATVTAGSFTSAPAPAPPVAQGNGYDAFINLGSSNFLEANQLTTGSPQAWYLSPTVEKLYNGIPTAAQQQQFTDNVLSRVEQTFALAGLHPTMTTDATAAANHTMSVVSGASYGPNANAIGITDVGNHGFSFIDKLNYGNDIKSLEWAVAHNVAHELMHAFGVGKHPDTSGGYIDAATTSWDLLTNENSTFSPDAASAIKATNFGSLTGANSTGAQVLALNLEGDQEILAAPIPEPATLLVWGLLGCGMITYRSRRRRNAA